MALNHMTSEQKYTRFNLSKDLNFVENFLRNNLPFDSFVIFDIFVNLTPVGVSNFDRSKLLLLKGIEKSGESLAPSYV